MLNLYELLRHVHKMASNGVPGAAPLSRDRYVTINDEQLAFLEHYLQGEDVVLHFKARKVSEQADGEPIMAQDFQIAGEGFEVFCLITEAMVNNYQFATIVQNAVGFYRDHIPTCVHCQKKHFGQEPPDLDWQFNHPKPATDGK